MRGSGASSSVKVGVSRTVCRMRLRRLAGIQAGRYPRGAARTLCVRADGSRPAVGSDEQLERKEIVKTMVSGIAKM